MKKKNSRPKSPRKQLSAEAKDFLRSQGLPVVSARYYEKLRQICPSFVAGDGFTMSYCDTNPEEFEREPTYFSFSSFSETFENPYFQKEDILARDIGRKFGINPEMLFTLIESKIDALEFVFSLELNGNQPAYHAIVVAVGNLEVAKKENIADEVDLLVSSRTFA